MKKLIALLLALVLVVGLVACAAKNDAPVVEDEIVDAPVENDAPVEDAPVEDVPVEDAPVADNYAVTVLETIWSVYADDQKFAIFGGNPETAVMDAPGAYDVAAGADYLASYLQMTADQLTGVDQAATMLHMMNANSFTSVVLQLNEEQTVEAFAQTVRDSIQNGQWICGFPEQLIIADVNGYVLVAYGVSDLMNTFEANLAAAFDGAEILYQEAIAG